MNKADLIEEVAKRNLNLSKKDAQVAVGAVFDCIQDALCRHERIDLRGFGSFSTRVRAAHLARNPRSGAQVEVPKRHKPYFRAGKLLAQEVNSAAKL